MGLYTGLLLDEAAVAGFARLHAKVPIDGYAIYSFYRKAVSLRGCSVTRVLKREREERRRGEKQKERGGNASL
jgi:hypothetical protein